MIVPKRRSVSAWDNQRVMGQTATLQTHDKGFSLLTLERGLWAQLSCQRPVITWYSKLWCALMCLGGGPGTMGQPTGPRSRYLTTTTFHFMVQ